MSSTPIAILGTGMTDMSRRDLSPETMAYQAVYEALGDAGLSPGELGLVVVGNATGGRLNNQACVRGQSWLRKAGLNDVAIINVDNSCAGGSSALHVATMVAAAQDRPVLALGVEKMWTGDRGETMAGIEDGLPADYRLDLHDRLAHTDDNPAGSILMGLNDGWAQRIMAERGVTLRQIAAAAVKAFDHAARNPLAQCQRTRTIEEVLSAPQVAGILTRLMCSSFTDGAAAAIVAGPAVAAPASAPRIIASVARSGNGLLDYHDRMTQTADAAWEAAGVGPSDVDLVELHDATAAEEIYALESLGLFGSGRPARPPNRVTPASTHPDWWSTRRAAWWAGGIPWAPPGWPRWWSWPTSCAGGRWGARWAGPGWAWPSTRAASSRVTPASSPSTR